MKKKIKVLTGIFFVIIGIYIFNFTDDIYTKNKAEELVKYDKAKIEQENETLIFKNFEYQGNLDAEYVLIYNQGGPETSLTHQELPYEYVKSVLKGKVNDILVVYMHQIQTANPELITEKVISFEQAKEYDSETTKKLSDVVKYFKSKQQKIIIVGVSFGAFVVQDYLAVYGSDLIDGTVICVGRLDIQDNFWKVFSEGKEYVFQNGIIPIEVVEGERTMNGDSTITAQNIPKLAAGLAYKRYTKLLQDIDLSNVIYIYGEKDEAVGRLTDKEINFLKSKNVEILKSSKGHRGAFDKFIKQGLIMAFSKKRKV